MKAFAEALKKWLHPACEALELVTAVLMMIGIVLSMVHLFLDMAQFRGLADGTGSLTVFVEKVFSIVIAIEFLQMLRKPDTDNVIEILIFLVARHMIVGETSPILDLVSIVSISILFILRVWLHRQRALRKQAEKAAGEDQP